MPWNKKKSPTYQTYTSKSPRREEGAEANSNAVDGGSKTNGDSLTSRQSKRDLANQEKQMEEKVSKEVERAYGFVPNLSISVRFGLRY